MGGIHGHISHPYEDRDLTFGALKDMMNQICDGSIETYEKLDGINLYITWNFEKSELQVARNKEHIKMGGINREQLKKKYCDRGVLLDAFLQAYDILNKAFSSLTNQTLLSIFGATGGVWYSTDIIYPEARNLIRYDEKFIVFHKTGVTMFDWEGDPVTSRTDRHFNMLTLVLKHLNEAIDGEGWKICGPSKIQLNCISRDVLNKHLSLIDSCTKKLKMRDYSSINDYLRKRLLDEMTSFIFVPHELREKILDRMLKKPGCQSVSQLCKGKVSAITHHIKELVNNAPKTIKTFMEPIEKTIYALSCVLLKNCKSPFVLAHDVEIQRIRKEIDKAISFINSSNDKKAKEFMQNHLNKLISSEKINTPVEGIVFIYRKKPYKLTGYFAPANQIYQHVKYKMSPVRETNKNDTLKNYVLGISAG